MKKITIISCLLIALLIILGFTFYTKKKESKNIDKIIQVTEPNAQKPVVIDFFATWCGPCQALGPILEELEQEYGNKYEFKKIDVDKHPDLMNQYGVEAMPTIVFERAGAIIYKHVGFASKEELRSMIKKYFE